MTKSKSGFTLIEVLVAISILSIALLITNGIFTRFIVNQRRDISEQELQEDVRINLELLASEIRTSHASTFAQKKRNDAEQTGPGIVFRDQTGSICVMHRRQGQAWQRSEKTTSEDCSNVTFDKFTTLTDASTNIEDLSFKIIPEPIVNQDKLIRQGFITVILKAKSSNTSIPAFSLQTTLTSRQTDV